MPPASPPGTGLAAPFLATLVLAAGHVSIPPAVVQVVARAAGIGVLAVSMRWATPLGFSLYPPDGDRGRLPALADTDLAGRVLSGYRLLERVAHGRHGDVWRGVHELQIHGDPGAAVAVKVATDATGARLLRAEAEAAAALEDHPRIAPVLAFASGPVPHLVRPWYAAMLRDRPSVAALLQVVEIVAAVHARGFRHGDLKPKNVFLTGDGHAVLADLGLARERPAARRAPRVPVLERVFLRDRRRVKDQTGPIAGEHVHHEGVGMFESDLDRQRIEHFHGVHSRIEAPHAGLRGGIHDAIDAELHGHGVDRRAVVELDALS